MSYTEKPKDVLQEPSKPEVLPNGAFVIERSYFESALGPCIVALCKWGNEYVTWRLDEKGNAYWGHYFQGDLGEAWRDYKDRCHVDSLSKMVRIGGKPEEVKP